jgi:hypothetical protein
MMQMALPGFVHAPIYKPVQCRPGSLQLGGRGRPVACHVLAVALSSSSAMGAERVQDDRVYVPSPG